METFSALLALCTGNSPVTCEFPYKGQWCGALMLSLICAWINGWVYNRETGDLRCHRTHYDVTVMDIIVPPVGLTLLTVWPLEDVVSILKVWIFKIILQNISLRISIRWMPCDLTNEKSILNLVMPWCHQATSPYLSQADPDLCCHIASIGHKELIVKTIANTGGD